MSAKMEVDGTLIGIEIDAVPGQRPAGFAETITARWDDASKAIQTMAMAVHSTLNNFSKDIRPQTVEVEFGLKLSGEADWVIGKAGGEAHIDVKFSYDLASR